MSVQVKNKVPVSNIPRNFGAFLNNTITWRYESFQAPFSERRVLLITMDSLLVLLAAVGAFALWQLKDGIFFDVNHIHTYWYMFPALLGGWWVLAWLNDLYDIPSSVKKALSATRVVTVGGLGTAIYVVAYFLVLPQTLPRLYFFTFLVMVLIAIILWRWVYASLFTMPSFQHRILIVGNGGRGRSSAKGLKQASGLNYHVVGYVEKGSTTRDIENEDLPIVGRIADLPHLAENLQIREVVVAIERHLDANLFQLLVECQARGVRISLMADLYEKLYRRVPIEYINPGWVLQVIQGRAVFNRLQLSLKRLTDLTLGVFALPVWALFLPLVALAIRLDSPGPIFYRQIRCGRAGKPFSIIKFRTMISDAEQDGKPRWATKNDDRITRVGRILRKARLDELPQVFNILRGEMSFIGPRPERPEFVEELQQEIPFYRARLMVKPGLTGWAQVHYNYGNSVEDALIKLQYDLYYLHSWSLWLDLHIIFKTFGVVFKFKGT